MKGNFKNGRISFLFISALYSTPLEFFPTHKQFTYLSIIILKYYLVCTASNSIENTVRCCFWGSWYKDDKNPVLFLQSAWSQGRETSRCSMIQCVLDSLTPDGTGVLRGPPLSHWGREKEGFQVEAHTWVKSWGILRNSVNQANEGGRGVKGIEATKIMMWGDRCANEHYCDNRFTIYRYQIITSYNLNSHSYLSIISQENWKKNLRKREVKTKICRRW